MFYCACLFFYFVTRFRAPSADRRETLPNDRKVVQFHNPVISKFGEPSLKKWGRKRAKFGAVSDNFKFDRQCLRNGSRYPKSENSHVSTAISPPFGEKRTLVR